MVERVVAIPVKIQNRTGAVLVAGLRQSMDSSETRARLAQYTALAALTLALLSSLYRRNPVGAFLLATAAMELYGLRDNRFLMWQVYPALAALVGIAATAAISFRRAFPGDRQRSRRRASW